MNKLIDKILIPNVYVRAGGALTGTGIGYLFSKASKDSKYKREVPEKLHIAPAILTGAVGYWIPILPFIGTVGLTLLYGSISYNLWEKEVLEESKKTSLNNK
jgi:hypothetical protein